MGGLLVAATRKSPTQTAMITYWTGSNVFRNEQGAFLSRRNPVLVRVSETSENEGS